MAIRTMSLGEALENGYEVIGPDPIYREEATGFETATSIGLEVVPAILGGVFGGMAGGAGGSALGNYLSQQYRIGRGLQDDVGLGELGAATAFGAVPVGRLAGMGKVGRPIINALGPRRLREVSQEGLDVEVQPGLPQPRTGSDVVIDITDTTQYAEDLVQRLENKLLLEAEGEVSKIARLKGQEVTKEVADLQNAFDTQLAEQDEIFKGINNQINLGVQKIGDTDAINNIKQRIAILDSRLGKGTGAKKERAKLQADLKRWMFLI